MEYTPLAAVPNMLDKIKRSDKLIIAQEILLGTSGTEYLTIFFMTILSCALNLTYLYIFNFLKIYKAAAILEIMADSNKPVIPIFKEAINHIFSPIVIILVRTLHIENNFIFPSPLATAFPIPIKTFAIK